MPIYPPNPIKQGRAARSQNIATPFSTLVLLPVYRRSSGKAARPWRYHYHFHHAIHLQHQGVAPIDAAASSCTYTVTTVLQFYVTAATLPTPTADALYFMGTMEDRGDEIVREFEQARPTHPGGSDKPTNAPTQNSIELEKALKKAREDFSKSSMMILAVIGTFTMPMLIHFWVH
jgi:hypothetical protein